MFPATTTAAGQCLGFPDTCKTPAPPAPPVPVPYPNLGMLTDAKGTTVSKKVKFENKPACHVMTVIARSSGDEAGTAGGVVSGKNMDQVAFKTGVAKVKIEGNDVVALTSMTAHNGASANMPAGVQIAPSQAKVLVTP
jgi:hypothetical protein